MSGKLRKWGNSYGVLIPSEVMKEAKLAEGQDVDLIVLPRDNPLKELFGLLKGKRRISTQEIKDQMRAELYDDP